LIWNVLWKAARDGEVGGRALLELVSVLEGEEAVGVEGFLLLF
jgi:hypothetical protein